MASRGAFIKALKAYNYSMSRVEWEDHNRECAELWAALTVEQRGAAQLADSRARIYAAGYGAGVETLRDWVISADAAYNIGGRRASMVDECAGLVRMCHLGRAAMDEVPRLLAVLQQVAEYMDLGAVEPVADALPGSSEHLAALVSSALVRNGEQRGTP